MIRDTIKRCLERCGVVFAPYWTKLGTIQDSGITVYAALSTFERLDDSSFTIKLRLDGTMGTRVMDTVFGPVFVQSLSGGAAETVEYSDNMRVIRRQILDLIPH